MLLKQKPEKQAFRSKGCHDEDDCCSKKSSWCIHLSAIFIFCVETRDRKIETAKSNCFKNASAHGLHKFYLILKFISYSFQ